MVENDNEILIVEDELIITKDLKILLKSLGYENITTAITGEDGIKKALSINPKLILMDIRLKKEIDGIQAVKQIKRINPEIPVIYISGYSDEDTKQRAESTNPLTYLSKPIKEDDIKEAVLKAFSKKENQLANTLWDTYKA